MPQAPNLTLNTLFYFVLQVVIDYFITNILIIEATQMLHKLPTCHCKWLIYLQLYGTQPSFAGDPRKADCSTFMSIEIALCRVRKNLERSKLARYSTWIPRRPRHSRQLTDLRAKLPKTTSRR
jgi:hypothetical protein